MSGRVGVEIVDAYYLIVRTRRKPASIWRESDGMNCARVIAHMT